MLSLLHVNMSSVERYVFLLIVLKVLNDEAYVCIFIHLIVLRTVLQELR